MSPAMVDVRSPAAERPGLRNPNPRTGGQSFSFSPSSFDSAVAPPEPRSMNPPNVSSRRKPRLVKLRRHAEGGAKGAGPVPGDGAGTSGRFGEVEDHLREWNPFVPAAKSGVSGSGRFDSGAGFVFAAENLGGAGGRSTTDISGNVELGFGVNHYHQVGASSSSSGPSVGAVKTLPDEMRKLNIGSNLEPILKLPYEMKKLNIGSKFGPASVLDNSKASGSTPIPSAGNGSGASYSTELKLNPNLVGASDGMPVTPAGDNGVFVFGARQHDEMTARSSVIEESLEKLLPDEMRKLNIGNAAEKSSDLGSNVNLKGTTVDGGQPKTFSSGNTEFVFGAKLPRVEKQLPPEICKQNISSESRCTSVLESASDLMGGFNSGKSGIDACSMFSRSCSQSVASDGLNDISSNFSGGDFWQPSRTERKEFKATSSCGMAANVTVSNNNNNRMGECSTHQANFDFGKFTGDGKPCFGKKQSNDSSVPTNFGHQVLAAGVRMTHPDEMKQLNIGRGFDEASAFKANKSSGFGSLDFLKVYGNDDGDGLEETACDATSVFGSNESRGLDEQSETKLSGEMCKLKLEKSFNSEGSDKAEDKDHKAKNEAKDAFVSDSFRNRACSASGESRKEMPNEVHFETEGKYSTGMNSSEDTVSGNADGKMFDGYAGPKSLPIPFIFQAGKDDEKLDIHTVPSVPMTDLPGQNGAVFLSSSSPYPGSGSVENVYIDVSTDKVETHSGYSFTSVRDESHMLHRGPHDPQTPKQDTFWSSKESFADGGHQNVIFSSTGGIAHKDTKLRKKRGKLKVKATAVLQKESISREESFQENSEISLSGCCSPMDFSPYHETLATERLSAETSWESMESFHRSTFVDEAAGMKSVGVNDECSNDVVEIRTGSEFFVQESTFKPKDEPLDHENVVSDMNNDVYGNKVSGSTIEKQTNNCDNLLHFTFGLEDSSGTGFKFSASSSQCSLSSARHKYRRKIRMKGCHESSSTSHNTNNHVASSMDHLFPVSSSAMQAGVISSDNKQTGSISQKDASKEPQVRQESVSMAATSLAAQRTCEEWRLRGNQAYKIGNLAEAEDYYTRGLNCVSPDETYKSCLRALMLCYSNRAVTRVALGRVREALDDCIAAASIDQSFLKVQVRAANCYLVLGEIDNAMKSFKNCLQSGSDLVLDKKFIVEASEGLKKAKHASDCLNRSTELLQLRLSDDASKALEFINEGLSISPFSDNLMRMKAEALLMLRKYDEVILLCEETLESASKNHCYSENVDGFDNVEDAHVRAWRWNLIAKSYFYLGRLEEAHGLLQKLEKVGPLDNKCRSNIPESSGSFAVTVRELLSHKAAGNEAFQAGRHLEAVQHYTAALACNVESRPFAAICFCNRAAAYQCLGQITDAIADCTLAIALDSSYPKAISRRATLHEMIRDYGHAVTDIQRLVSLLEEKAKDKSNQHGQFPNIVNDLKQVRSRLATMEQEARKDAPLNMYLILGIDPEGTSVEIKKAYRKAALRHHPDKAGQFLARNENGDDQLWKEVSDEVNRDADRLFKLIGEAYAVLSDPKKRLQYDSEEEIRNVQNKRGNVSTADVHNYPFERSATRRQWKDVRKSYESPRHRWSEDFFFK